MKNFNKQFAILMFGGLALIILGVIYLSIEGNSKHTDVPEVEVVKQQPIVEQPVHVPFKYNITCGIGNSIYKDVSIGEIEYIHNGCAIKYLSYNNGSPDSITIMGGTIEITKYNGREQ
jgi:hypothetical protein